VLARGSGISLSRHSIQKMLRRARWSSAVRADFRLAFGCAYFARDDRADRLRVVFDELRRRAIFWLSSSEGSLEVRVQWADVLGLTPTGVALGDHHVEQTTGDVLRGFDQAESGRR